LGSRFGRLPGMALPMSSAMYAAAGAPALPVVPLASLQLSSALQRKPTASSSSLAVASMAFTAATMLGHSKVCSFSTIRKSQAAPSSRGDVRRRDGVGGGVVGKLLGGGRKHLEDPEVMNQRMRERRQQDLTELEQKLSERKPCELDLRLEKLRQANAKARARAQKNGGVVGQVNGTQSYSNLLDTDLRLEKMRQQQAQVRARAQEEKARQRAELKSVLATREQLQKQPLDGWRMVVMGDGTCFYANEQSGARSWEAPVPGAPIVAREPNEGAKETKPLLRVLDLMSGLWYYYDERAACSSWEAPHGMRMAECPPAPPSPWRRVLHTSSCEWCYLNEKARETRWELPPAARESEVVA